MPTLYEITNDMAEVLGEIQANDGELTPELQEKLAITEEDRDRKAIAYLEIIKKKKSFLSTVDEEIKRLQAIKKREMNSVNWLEENLLSAVAVFGEFQVGTITFGMSSRPKLEVDEDLLEEVKRLEFNVSITGESEKKLSIDPSWLNIKTTAAIDKKAVTDAIKNDDKIDGCSLIKSKFLNIK